MHLKFLFGAISKHGFVPEGFGASTGIPLLKDKAGNVTDIHSYRAITLVPVISKLFEGVILKFYEAILVTDQLQFGFRQNSGCADALFALKTTISHFIANGSSVFAASLDHSKAFDRVNHFKLYNSMLSTGIPVYIVNVLCNWYSKLLVSVRWNDGLAGSSSVGSCVRQGSALSPAILMFS